MEKNITEELIRFLMEEIKNLRRENTELKLKIDAIKVPTECTYYYDGRCGISGTYKICSCKGIRKNCDSIY